MMAFIAELSCVFWVEQGYIGLLLAIATICSFLLLPCLKKDHLLQVCIRGSLVAWCIFSCFSYPASHFQTRVLFFILLGIAGGFLPVVWHVEYKIFVPIGVGLTILFAVLVVPFHQSVVYWEDCLKDGEIKHVERLAPLLNSSFVLSNSALFLNKSNQFELAEEIAGKGFLLYHSYFSALELGKSLKNQGKYAEAAQIWEEAAALVPNRFTPLFLEMEMWHEKGDIRQAREMAGRILNKPIKVPSSQLTYMRLRARCILKERNK